MNFTKSIIAFFILSIGFSQNVDTKYTALLKKLGTVKTQEEKIDLYFSLSQEIEHTDIKKSKYYSKVILLLSKKNKYKRGIGLYFNTQASINFKLNNFNKGLAAANVAEKIFIEKKDTLFYLKNIRTKARILNKLNDKKEEYKCLNKAFKVAIKTNNYTEIADISYLLAADFVYDDVQKSFNYLNIAAKNFEMGKDYIGLAGCYYLLSSTYYDTGQYDKAEHYINKSFEIVKKFENRKNFQIFCFRVFTTIYIKQKKYIKATNSAKSAILFNSKYGGKYNLSNDYVTLAEIYLFRKKYNLASTYLYKALNLNPDSDTKFSIYKNLGVIKYETKQFELAKKFQLEAIRMLDSTKLKTDRKIFKELSYTFFALKNYPESYKYLEKFSDLNSEYLTEEKDSKIHELQIKFELNDKEAELQKTKFIEKQNLTNYKYEKRKNYLLLIAFGLVLILCLTFLIFYVLIKDKNRLLQKQNEIIASKNLALNESNEKVSNLLVIRETLLKEIHHRVKNNLQLVTSLLNIQAQDAQNISIDDFLIKGRLRIATISLIHQNLYQNNSLAKINFQNYLENLVDSILDSFNNPNVTIAVQMHENDFDIDTSIPLGLIINELVCNSLKHAFTNQQDVDRTISIQLYKKENELYVLEIGDNGVGRPDTIKNSNSSIGLEIVSLLVKQLKGTMQLLEKKGTNYLIEFTEITKQ